MESQQPSKHRQVGPPVRVGSYRVFVVDDESHVLARAEKVDLQALGASYAQVHTGGLLVEGFLPYDVLMALLKIAGMGVEWKRKT